MQAGGRRSRLCAMGATDVCPSGVGEAAGLMWMRIDGWMYPIVTILPLEWLRVTWNVFH